MIHRIHAGGDFLTLDHGGPVSFAEVTYPQDINTCDKCHDGLEASLAYSNPTRRNCGSCHAAVDFATGVGHAGGALDNDASCSLCHSAASIESIHKPAPILANTPEFDVTISMTAPANGTHYVAGEAPVVTVTLADHATGTAVAGTVYTADQDVEGVGGVAEGLSLASLYVYGPRNEAVPVLATDTMHDPAFVAPPTQAHPLFVNELVGGVPTANDDPLVTTTAAGFSYQLLAIPAGMEAGTYMVRFEGADYGALSATDYRTSSSAFITFQVETATEEAKVSGDGCLECHGATIMHLEGAHPHYAAFDTDACLGCHDLSGNYADYIGNRVHAIHRASVTGDLHARDWSEVTFPRPANNCITCHTDTTADTPVWRTPGGVVCGGCHGADPTAVPAGFPTADPDQILREAAAAQHMQQNGADFNPTTPATLSCLVCHGEGRTADLYDTHNLIAFRPLPVDPNE
jgi:OmcA/MtrC family decaheme c-type cytochrome